MSQPVRQLRAGTKRILVVTGAVADLLVAAGLVVLIRSSGRSPYLLVAGCAAALAWSFLLVRTLRRSGHTTLIARPRAERLVRRVSFILLGSILPLGLLGALLTHWWRSAILLVLIPLVGYLVTFVIRVGFMAPRVGSALRNVRAGGKREV